MTHRSTKRATCASFALKPPNCLKPAHASAQYSPRARLKLRKLAQPTDKRWAPLSRSLTTSSTTTGMGKTRGDDLREGKSTLPLIGAMERGTEIQGEVVRQAIEQGSTEQLTDIVQIVRETGALEVTRAAAFGEARRAMAAAEQLPTNAYSAALLELAAQLLTRRN